MPTSFDPAKPNQQPSFESDISGQRFTTGFFEKVDPLATRLTMIWDNTPGIVQYQLI